MSLKNRNRPKVNEEQLQLEKIELEWMRKNKPPLAEKRIAHRRGGKVLIQRGETELGTGFSFYEEVLDRLVLFAYMKPRHLPYDLRRRT